MADIIEDSYETTTIRRKTVRSLKIQEVSTYFSFTTCINYIPIFKTFLFQQF
jgi:hypothetical protein